MAASVSPSWMSHREKMGSSNHSHTIVHTQGTVQHLPLVHHLVHTVLGGCASRTRPCHGTACAQCGRGTASGNLPEGHLVTLFMGQVDASMIANGGQKAEWEH